MPLPTWLARANRRWVNPKAVERGKWPVLHHVGRKSGKDYRTPLDVFEIDGGFLFTVNYGSSSDWPRNVMAAGGAVLEKDGVRYELVEPRLVPANEGYRMLHPHAKTPPSLVKVEECLVVAAASSSPSASGQTRRSRSTS